MDVNTIKSTFSADNIKGDIGKYSAAAAISGSALPQVHQIQEAIAADALDARTLYHNLTNPSERSLALGIAPNQGLSFEKFIEHRYGISPAEGTAALDRLNPFLSMAGINRYGVGQMGLGRYYDSGVDQKGDPNANLRWLVSEVLLVAIRQGLVVPAVWDSLVFATYTTTQPTVTIPIIKAPFAQMRELGEATTSTETNYSFGQKRLETRKYGMKISLTDEVTSYVSMDLFAAALTQLGSSTNAALNLQAVNTLLNGDLSADSAAVTVGVATPNTLAYTDLLTLYAEASKVGLFYDTVLVSDTATFVNLTQLAEIRGYAGETKSLTISSAIPLINNLNVKLVYGLPAGAIMFVDTRSALYRVNENTGTTMETARNADKQQTDLFYRIRGVFGRSFQESAVLLDTTLAYNTDQTSWGFDAANNQPFLPRV